MDEQQNTRKRGWRIAMIACGAVCVLCVIGIIAYSLPGWLPWGTVVPPTSSQDGTDENLSENPIDFASLQAKNPDTVAWISIPGTKIDYPVMRSGRDRAENFYLDHNSDGEKHRAGAIYMQKINSGDFTDRNTVLYGHNMANGSMFSWLHRYKKKTFFDEHRTITVYTPGHILTYEIYSAFLYDNRHILNSFNFDSDEDYAAFLQQTLNPSTMVRQVREGVSVTTAARIITLSTCNSHSGERYLVIGVLTHDQRTK
ncbi:MAG: class B sortase [Clostridia bacterium]|nr:class B sortase [Clostridia bacterium]